MTGGGFVDEGLAGVGGGEVLEEHVGGVEKAAEGLTAGVVIGEADGLLAAVPDDVAAGAEGRVVGAEDADHAGAVLAEEHRGEGAGGVGGEVDDEEVLEGSGHRGRSDGNCTPVCGMGR